MKPVVLTATILGAFAIAAATSLVVSPASRVSMSNSASTPAESAPDAPAAAKTSVAALPETGRPPVPIVRPQNEQAQMPPASPSAPAPTPIPAPVAEVPPVPAPPATVSRGPSPSVDDKPLSEQQLHSALASLPRGPDIRYWIVPLDDGRVKVIAGRKGDPGPDGWGDKSAKHRRN